MRIAPAANGGRGRGAAELIPFVDLTNKLRSNPSLPSGHGVKLCQDKRMTTTAPDQAPRASRRFRFWRVVAVVAVTCLVLTPFAVRGFLYQPFSIPSGAQMPTLLIGDYLFASKYAYGTSLPFSGRISVSEPRVGDVVVFKLPRDGTTDYIKRVVGLPGDRIRVTKGILHINDQPVKRERIADFQLKDDDGSEKPVPQYTETLPNGVTHRIIEIQGDDGFLDNTSEFVVKPGHFFVLGDNRDNSVDSRDASVGQVPFENLVGRAEVIFWSVDPEGSVRTDRIGMSVR